MTTSHSTPLPSFFDGLLSGGTLEATLIEDNARIHGDQRRAHSETPPKSRKRSPSRVCRWKSSPSHKETIGVEEVQYQKKNPNPSSKRRSRRSRSFEAAKDELNRERFCLGDSNSEENVSPKQPKRQLTPDINSDIETVIAMKRSLLQSPKQPIRQLTPDVNYDIERAMAIKKPQRQLTPPNIAVA